MDDSLEDLANDILAEKKEELLYNISYIIEDLNIYELEKLLKYIKKKYPYARH